uniref:tyrosine-type recombinase/integrase n=1 Tax=Kitasatospora mediocidica TaxID=58352 RepID=UPI0038BCBBAD
MSTRPNGAPIEGATLTRHFTALLRRARIRRIRFHDLRHSAATLLLQQGVELVVTKELLGHAHTGVTATVYTTSDSASSAKPRHPPRPRNGHHRTRRRRRTGTLWSTRPLTLPSTTAVRRPRSPTGNIPVGLLDVFPFDQERQLHRQSSDQRRNITALQSNQDPATTGRSGKH